MDEARHQRLFGRDRGQAVHTQHFVDTRKEEQQTNRRLVRDVGQGVEPVVAGPVGKGDVRIVERMDEARLAAARRYVAKTIRARRTDAKEGRERGEWGDIAARMGPLVSIDA